MIQTSAVLFIDVVGSVAASKILGARRYEDDFLVPLQRCFHRMLYIHGIPGTKPLDTSLSSWEFPIPLTPGRDVWWNIAGDELCVVISRPEPELPLILWRLLEFAFETKSVWWQQSPPNDATEYYASLFELGIGIHVGPLCIKHREWKPMASPQDLSAEGIALNEAKRIEAISREGRASKVILSDEAWRVLRRKDTLCDMLTRPLDTQSKGLGQLKVHEVTAYWSQYVIRTPGNEDLLLNILKRRPFDIAACTMMAIHLRRKNDLSRAKELEQIMYLFSAPSPSSV